MKAPLPAYSFPIDLLDLARRDIELAIEARRGGNDAEMRVKLYLAKASISEELMKAPRAAPAKGGAL